MRRRLLVNLGVVAVALLLAAVAWVDHRYADDSPPRLTDLARDAIDVVHIQGADGQAVRLERREAGWWITKPVRARASDFHVGRLTELARTPSEARYSADELDAGRVGLLPPRVNVAFNGVSIGFGEIEPVEGLRYAQVDDTIHLISSRLMPLVEGPWWNLLDRHLLPPRSEPRRLVTPSLEVHRDGEGWHLVRGDPPDAGPAGLMTAWQRAEALVARPVEGATDAPAEVEVTLDNGDRRRFRVADTEGEVRLVDVDAGVAYVLGAAVRRYLLHGEQD